jgi:hypothetical protein
MLTNPSTIPRRTSSRYGDTAHKWFVRCLVIGFSLGYLLHLPWLQDGALLLFLLLVLPHEFKASRFERFSPSIALTVSWCSVLVLFGLAILIDAGHTAEVILLITIWLLIAVAATINPTVQRSENDRPTE